LNPEIIRNSNSTLFREEERGREGGREGRRRGKKEGEEEEGGKRGRRKRGEEEPYDNEDDRLGVLIVVAPQRTHLVSRANVPDRKVHILILNCLHLL